MRQARRPLWVEQVADDDNVYRVDNIPIFATVVSLNDLVKGVVKEDGRLYFDAVVSRSGLITIVAFAKVAQTDGMRKVVEFLNSIAIGMESYKDQYAFAMTAEQWLHAGETLDDILIESGSGDEEVFVGEIVPE